MIMCVLLCYPVSIHMSQLLSTGHPISSFLCQLTCQSADIMSSVCGVGVRVRVNNFFSKTTRPRDMLFFFKRYLIYRG